MSAAGEFMEPLFTVTVADIAALPTEQFDALWEALGDVVRARAGKPRRQPPADPATRVAAPPVPIAEPPQILHAVDVASEEEAEPELVATPQAVARTRSVRPLAPITVPCDPGCGLPFGQAEIAAHRRECEAVARHKAERGVRVVPSLASAAPLPAVPESDFAEKREANARAASEASWQRRNPAGQMDTSDVDLTANQQRVVEALRKTSGNQAEANEVLGYERGSARVAAAIGHMRQMKRLPADVDVLLRGAKRPPRKAASS